METTWPSKQNVCSLVLSRSLPTPPVVKEPSVLLQVRADVSLLIPEPTSFLLSFASSAVQPAPNGAHDGKGNPAADNAKALITEFRCEQKTSISLYFPQQLYPPNDA